MSEDEATYRTEPQEEEPKPAPPPPRRTKRVSVRVVSQSKTASLVEWKAGETTRRAYLPNEEVKSGQVSEDALESATPYGETWEVLITLPITPLQVAEAWRGRGIWTLDDLAMNRQKAAAAIEALLRPIISTCIRETKEAMHG